MVSIIASLSAVIDPARYKWYEYKGSKIHTIKNKNAQIAKITKGTLWGMRNLNNRLDRVVTQAVPNAIFSLTVEFVEDLLDDSVRYKNVVTVTAPPRKKRTVPVKIRIIPPPKPVKPVRPIKLKPVTPISKPVPKVEKISKPAKPALDFDDMLLDTEEDFDARTFLSDYVRKS